MRITVINHSEYTDEYVQEVIRAVNRQIQEDFEPYWHRGGELRLEGPIGSRPDPRYPEELRGDAILYLWSDVDQEDALGYHELNFRGIPFGIVFTELSEDLGEPWTVTLSHEALELIMDPEANLLVRGPHPEDPGRSVYHWYEMCDAVQTQTYEIDGVEVSNFVLPLYFTEGNEEGSRNDFLGHEGEDGPLPSFGVADGGYVGFFDPETQRDEQFHARRGHAVERSRLKEKAGWARRPLRRQLEASPEPILRRICKLQPGEPLPGPWFEGFAIDVLQRGDEDPYDVLDAAATAVLGRSWAREWLACEPTAPAATGPVAYELVPQGISVSVGRAWELSYAFQEQRGVIDAEPDFVFFRAECGALDDLPPGRRLALFGNGDLGGTVSPEWSLEQMHVAEAWEKSHGRDVVIGHPDTGFLEHPEIWSGAGTGPIDTERDYDFVGDEDDARAEPSEDNLLPAGPNHGTATASVIVSARGSDADTPDEPFVSGVAPEARLVPLRVGNSPIHFSMRRVRKAIEYATGQGFHLLSMALGGPFPNRHLRRAIRKAERKGLILIAASGNYIPFRPVIWPARYPEVIGVAACNIEKRPWRGSSRGKTIDITAPGESVWRALVDSDAQPSERYLVERSHGTSYAAAHVSGVCALWLSHHGPDWLFAKYGERLTDAFRYVLAQTAQRSDHLDPDAFGPGIVHAGKVLRLPLPSKDRVARWTDGGGLGQRTRRRRSKQGDEDGALAVLEALFPHLDRGAILEGLAHLLDLEPAALARRVGRVGHELALRFASDPSLCRQFSASCNRSARIRGRSAYDRLWRRGAFANLRGRLRRDVSADLGKLLE